MKKNTLTYLGMVLLSVLFGAQLMAQTTVNMPLNNGPATFTIAPPGTCSFNFFDNGGAAANYANNSGVNSVVTFAPATPATHKIQVSFSSFSTEAGWDALYVFDGATTASPLITSGLGATIGGFPAGGFQGGVAPNNIGAGLVRATAANASGALTFQFRSDASVTSAGWASVVAQVPISGCAMTAPANITTSTGTANCTADVVTPLPAFNPAGCQNSLTLQYRVDNGAFIAVPPPTPPTITLPGIPSGIHAITWRLIDPCGGAVIATVTQTITVNDLVPPVITCPANIVTTLGPGECDRIINYAPVTATDNCPLISQVLYTQNPPVLNPAQPINAAQSLNCGGAQTKFGRVFGGPTQPAFMLTGLQCGIRATGGAYTFQIYRLTSGTAPAAGNANLVALAPPFNMTMPAVITTYVPVTFPAPIAVPAGSFFFVEIISQTGNFSMGNILAPDLPGTPSYIAAAACGLANYGTFASLGFAQLSLAFNVVGNMSAPPPSQTSGLASGSTFPIGTTQNCFIAFDVAGNTATCCFNVTVNPFPNPTLSLVCNDLVQVSLDTLCQGVLNADDILEGGPYGCYLTRYTVMLLGPTGQPLGNIVNSTHIGPLWTVKVTDVVTGNSCWGKIKVEDKLKPKIKCTSFAVSCTEDLNAPALVHPSPAILIQGPALFTINTGGNAGAVGGMVYFNITNLTANPVTVTELGMNISAATTVNVFRKAGTHVGFEANAGAWTMVGTANATTGPFSGPFPGNGTITPAPTSFVIPPGLHGIALGTPTAQQNYTNGNGANQTFTNGTITLNLGSASNTPFAAPFTPRVWNGYVKHKIEFLQVAPTDNCGPVTLSHATSSTTGACGGPSGTVVRTWTATDPSGNSASCNQTITIDRPDLDDVAFPSDIKWTCEQYAAFPNITSATPLHPYIKDSAPGTDIIDVNLVPTCDDQDQAFQDIATMNSTNIANGGLGCPGNGLDDADVLALTGSGIPTVNGKPLVAICGIGYEHVDLLVPVCAGTFKIVRKWTLIDWCANPVDVREFNQVIKVVDDKDPTITVPAELTIDMYNGSVPAGGGPHAVCAGAVVVPPATGVTDNCSGVSSYITEIWTLAGQLLQSINTNGGVFINIPMFENGLPAMYNVRYYATDGCGNQGTATTKITLQDKVPPVAVCDEITEVSITNNGINTGESCSTMNAASLDDGSYDNCKPVYFLVAKMIDPAAPASTPAPPGGGTGQTIYNRCYYPTLDFCCADIAYAQQYGGGFITVVLLVLDGQPALQNPGLNFPGAGCNGSPSLFLSPSFSALNYNSCMVKVQVTDKLPPILVSCPANKRITCDNYADNLEEFLGTGSTLTPAQKSQKLTDLGHGAAATFFDNCATIITPAVTVSLDNCLEGTINRTWTVVDNAGNAGLQTCTQTIFVDHVSDWVVEFPADLVVNCGNTVPDFGEPEIFFETCELVAISHSDQIFTTVPDACYKIARKWTVINWCVVGANIDEEVIEQPENQLGLPFPQCDLDGDGDCDVRTFRDSWRGFAPTPNPFAPTAYRLRPAAADANASNNPDTDADTEPWDGYITYEQTIKVKDEVKPIFTNGCVIPDVCISDNTCAATVTLPTPDVTDCSTNVTKTATGQLGNGFGPFFNVAPGTYTVQYKAIDNCNNQTVCNSTVTVKDCKKPTPYCKNGLVIELMVVIPPMVQVWANDFNAGSFDNCPGTLKISFSADVNDTGRTYDCDDLGQQPVQMWVTDAAGNQDYCETFVIIQANMGQCTDDPQVAGATTTESNAGVQNVSVGINNANGSFTQTVKTAATTGQYNFPSVPSGGDYTITPALDVNPLNGVSTFDLVLISKHILGVELLNTPYKMIAADANKSNSVTTFDLVEIRKLILFINTNFPNNTSWRFVPKSYTFANPANPFATQFPEVINVNNLTVASMSNNFTAIKVGDVNGSAVTNLLGGTDDRNMVGDLVLNTDDVNVREGETYTVEFKATDFNASGYQFTLNFDKNALEFVEVVPAIADASNFGMTMLKEGVLTSSWNSDEAKQLNSGDVVFALTFKAKQSGRLSDLLNINSRYTVAEAYNANAGLLNVALSFNNSTVATGFELYQNTPNPFAGMTTVGFWLPEATSATMTISDVQGKVVKVINGDFSKGYNQVSLKRGDLGATGVLYYRLDTNTDSATRKMILVD